MGCQCAIELSCTALQRGQLIRIGRAPCASRAMLAQLALVGQMREDVLYRCVPREVGSVLADTCVGLID